MLRIAQFYLLHTHNSVIAVFVVIVGRAIAVCASFCKLFAGILVIKFLVALHYTYIGGSFKALTSTSEFRNGFLCPPIILGRRYSTLLYFVRIRFFQTLR